MARAPLYDNPPAAAPAAPADPAMAAAPMDGGGAPADGGMPAEAAPVDDMPVRHDRERRDAVKMHEGQRRDAWANMRDEIDKMISRQETELKAIFARHMDEMGGGKDKPAAKKGA